MQSSKYTFRLGNYRCFGREAPAEFTIGDGITAFVGRNNSGKSALLRFFYDFRPAFGLFRNAPTPENQTIHFTFPPIVRSHSDVFCDRNDGDMSVAIGLPALDTPGETNQPHTIATKLKRLSGDFHVEAINGFGHRAFSKTQVTHGKIVSTANGEVLCTQRGLVHGTEFLARSCYIPSNRNATSGGGSQSFDVMVGEAFVSDWLGARTGDDRARRELMSRVEKDVARLMGFSRFEAKKSASSNSLLVQIDEHDYHLLDVGAGVMHLLMLLGTVALKNPSFLFIDEPELSLHPSLQLDLLSALAGYVKGNLVFATHNIGLARAAATRIYVVTQEKPGCSKVHLLEDTPTLAQFLGELQYGAYSQVGGARVLLVEGPKDVLVFQQILRQFGADHQVIVLPLGGSTLINGQCAIHLNEVTRICPTIAAVIDSERTSVNAADEPPRLEFKANCERLGIQCLIVERRATENYFPKRALQSAFGDRATALDEYSKLQGTEGWSKGDGWLAAQQMTKDEILSTDIGRFLQQWLEKSKPAR